MQTHTHARTHCEMFVSSYRVMREISEDMEFSFPGCLLVYTSPQRGVKCMKCHRSPDLCTQVGVCMSGLLFASGGKKGY